MSDLNQDFDRAQNGLAELERLAAEWIADLKSGAPASRKTQELTKLIGALASAKELIALKQEIERERQEYMLLQDVSLRLSSAADIREVLRTILESLRQVVNYDAAGIFVLNQEEGVIEVDMLAGYQGAQRRRVYSKFQEGVKQGEGIVATVVFSQKPLYVPDVTRDPRYVEVRPTTRSELAVPIFVRNELIGAFNLESDQLDAFSQRDLRILQTFASHAGVALERARSDRQRQHTQRIQEELSLARRIHTGFLPKEMPVFPPFDMGGMNFPSSEVGGDYYDFVPITDDDLGIVMSDVAGHGVAAALLMANFRACIRIEARAHYAIKTILERVNQFLVETIPPDSFVTAVYGVLNRKHQVLTYANAGHNPPLLLRANQPPSLLDVGGPILGFLPNVTYEEAQVHLEPGDLLIFYTDGVTESRDESGQEYGLERLADAALRHRELSANEMTRRISYEIYAFQAPDSTVDDLTLSVVKYDPAVAN